MLERHPRTTPKIHVTADSYLVQIGCLGAGDFRLVALRKNGTIVTVATLRCVTRLSITMFHSSVLVDWLQRHMPLFATAV